MYVRTRRYISLNEYTYVYVYLTERARLHTHYTSVYAHVQKLVVQRSGKNKKKLWEYPQCPGLESQMLAITKQRGLSDDEKYEQCSLLLSDRDT